MARNLASDQIDIEHVVTVIDVGHAEVCLQHDVLCEIELTLYVKVETMVGRQTARIEVTIKYAKFTIGSGVVKVDAIWKE